MFGVVSSLDPSSVLFLVPPLGRPPVTELVSIHINHSHVTELFTLPARLHRSDYRTNIWLCFLTSPRETRDARPQMHKTSSRWRRQVEGDAWRRYQTELWVILRYEATDSSLMSASLTLQIRHQRDNENTIQMHCSIWFSSYLVSEFCSRLCLLTFHTPQSAVTFNSRSDTSAGV